MPRTLMHERRGPDSTARTDRQRVRSANACASTARCASCRKQHGEGAREGRREGAGAGERRVMSCNMTQPCRTAQQPRPAAPRPRRGAPPPPRRPGARRWQSRSPEINIAHNRPPCDMQCRAHNSAQGHKRAIEPQARRSHLSNSQACHSTRPGKKMEDDVAHAAVAQPHRLRTRLAWNQNANCCKI